MIKLNLTEEEAQIIFASLNSYRISHALSIMKEYPMDNITKDELIKKLDILIETIYYLLTNQILLDIIRMPTVQLNKVKSTIYILLAHILSGRYNKAYRKVCLFYLPKEYQ